jgi:hypothetical protein
MALSHLEDQTIFITFRDVFTPHIDPAVTLQIFQYILTFPMGFGQGRGALLALQGVVRTEGCCQDLFF